MTIRNAFARLATAAFVGALLASPAAAQLPNSSACGGPAAGGEYNLCYALSNFQIAGNTFSIYLANLTSTAFGTNLHMSEFVIAGLGSAYTVTDITGITPDAPQISGTDGSSLGFTGQGLVGGTNYIGFNYSGNKGIAQGATPTTLTFTLDKAIVASDFAGPDIQLAFHVQGATVGSCASTKAVFSGAGVRADGTVDYAAAGAPTSCTPPVTSTPEPASMALMGTGLLAIGGLGLRRRRNTV